MGERQLCDAPCVCQQLFVLLETTQRRRSANKAAGAVSGKAPPTTGIGVRVGYCRT